MSIVSRLNEDKGGSSFGDLKFYLGVIAAFAVAFLVFLPKAPLATPEQIAQAQAQAAAEAARPHEPDWASVCSSTQIYIEDHLKSPGSGRGFSDCHIVSVSSDKRMVLIRGSYTAVNSFNARIKETYAATLNRNDARDDHGWNISAFTN
jgi:hypothetical protein